MKQHEFTGKTRRLFDEEPYMREFEGNMVSCKRLENGRYSVILDRTAFFPEGGGQPADTGVLRCREETIRVIDVQERDGEICHITELPVSSEAVAGEIDFKVRYERMRAHSGEHILSGAAYRMFSCTNVGFHLNDEAVTVDLDKQLTHEQLMQLEGAVNDIIAENVKITAYFPSAEMLGELDYRSKLDLTENVRIVEIGENGCYDRCACCAPHVSSTAEVGSLIIVDSINYKGGTRLTMVCGKNAVSVSRTALTNARETAMLFSAKYSEAAQAAARFIKQTEDDKARAAAVCSAYIDMRVSQLKPTEGNIVLFEPQLDRNALRRLVDRAAEFCGGICAGFTGNDDEGWTYVLISRTRDLKAEAKSLNEKMNGRGGGTAQMIQGTAHASRTVLEDIF